MKKYFVFTAILFFAALFLSSCGDKEEAQTPPTKESPEKLLDNSYNRVKNALVGTWNRSEFYSTNYGRNDWVDGSGMQWVFNADNTAIQRSTEVDFTCNWTYELKKDSYKLSTILSNKTKYPEHINTYYPYTAGTVTLYLKCLDYKNSDKAFYVDIEPDGRMIFYSTNYYGKGDDKIVGQQDERWIKQ